MKYLRNIFIVFLILLFTTVGIHLFLEKHKLDNASFDDLDDLKKLENILSKSGYFENAKYTYDTVNRKLTINNMLDVFIKPNKYLMNVKNEKLEDIYCNIIDAVAMNLGGLKGNSNNTCKLTLDGEISMGSINVEFFDTYKILTINNNEKPILYNVKSSRIAGELISVDEINYDIKFDNYTFTLLNYKNTDNADMICGNVFSKKSKKDAFTFKIYNENRKELDFKDYKYSNDTKKYIPFCVEFSQHSDTVRYFSIESLNTKKN